MGIGEVGTACQKWRQYSLAPGGVRRRLGFVAGHPAERLVRESLFFLA